MFVDVRGTRINEGGCDVRRYPFRGRRQRASSQKRNRGGHFDRSVRHQLNGE